MIKKISDEIWVPATEKAWQLIRMHYHYHKRLSVVCEKNINYSFVVCDVVRDQFEEDILDESTS